SVTSTVANVTVVGRVEGKVDITYNSPGTGGQLFVLPDGSLISVTGANLYKYSPEGVLLTNRNVTGMNFTTIFLDESNRLLLVNSSGVNNLRRINTGDLTDDPTFNTPTVNATINSATELSGHGYLLAGNFASITNAGVSTNALTSICLVNYSGLVDTNFNAGPSPGGPTRIVVDSGTNIYALGSWTFWNGGYETKGFVKLNQDGSRDLSFSAPSLDSTKFLKPLTPGKLLAVDNLRRLVVMNPNGSLDSSFNPAHYSVNNTINAVALGESNKLYVVGLFSSYGSAGVGKYMRLFPDGTVDTNFDSSVGPTSQGFSSAAYNPRGYLYLVRNYSSGSFQGEAYGYGPYRVFAGTGGVSATGFDKWATQYTFPPGQEGPGDDADGDGIPNIFEYYFASNPTNATSGSQPEEVTVNLGGTDYPAITFVRSKTAGGVTLIPQVSSDVEFADSLGYTESATDLGNGTERVTIRSNVSITSQTAQFLRIQLSVP
ncbi:MAG TPA: delta-60 repeat domain-containing protein, partial [Verrucomicrobiae bacterium]|nr:delta-60 repeat domain-containing protein [Verrucomicrobiae bacterium]